MNKFMQALEIDAGKFAAHINECYGWIAENEILRQFLEMFPEYDCIVFDEYEIEDFLVNYLNEEGIEIKEGDGEEEL